MAHDLTLSPANTGVITVPDDGDDLLAASVEVPLQQLGDWVRWIYVRAANITPFGDLTMGAITTGNITAGGTIFANAGIVSALGVQASSFTATTAIVTPIITVSGASTLTGVVTTGTHVQSGGNVEAAGSLIAATGSDVPRRAVNGPDSTTTISTKDADIWFAVLTATRTWTPSTTGAKNGQVVFFVNDTPAAFDLVIAGPDGVTIPPGGMAMYVLMAGAYRLMKLWA